MGCKSARDGGYKLEFARGLGHFVEVEVFAYGIVLAVFVAAYGPKILVESLDRRGGQCRVVTLAPQERASVGAVVAAIYIACNRVEGHVGSHEGVIAHHLCTGGFPCLGVEGNHVIHFIVPLLHEICRVERALAVVIARVYHVLCCCKKI